MLNLKNQLNVIPLYQKGEYSNIQLIYLNNSLSFQYRPVDFKAISNDFSYRRDAIELTWCDLVAPFTNMV